MRARVVTDTDVALLRALVTDRSIVAASRRLGISRDRATYRIARLETAFGGAVVRSVRGGRGYGASRLTALGARIVRGGFRSVELPAPARTRAGSAPNRLVGTYQSRPVPQLRLAGGIPLRVAFPAREGERVTVLIDPESILVALGRFRSSARNVLAAEVERVSPGPGARVATLYVRVDPVRLRVAVTEEPLRQLGLVRGARIWLYVKATAVRRSPIAPPLAIRGSPRR